MRLTGILALVAGILATPVAAQAPARMQQVPARQAGEGEGPYAKLVIRGATVIKGDGSPPIGPMDIVIEGNRIADVSAAGTPGVPMKPNRPPNDATKEIDATGMWVMPGSSIRTVIMAIREKHPTRPTATSSGLRMG